MQKKICKLITDPRAIFIAVLALTLVTQTEGFCSDGKELENVTVDIKNVLFSSGVRKAALTLGLGAGLFQAFMVGSIRPLIIYGGLGLAVCYLPKIVDMIGGITV